MEQTTRERAPVGALVWAVVLAVGYGAGCSSATEQGQRPQDVGNVAPQAGNTAANAMPTAGNGGTLSGNPLDPQQPAAGNGSESNTDTPTTTGSSMPCAVETVVRGKCQLCHGATPLGGAPMPLVSAEDFQQDYPVKTTPQLQGQTLKVHELARIRVNREMGTSVMPQGTPLAASELAMLTDWLQAGAPAGIACDPDSVTGGDDGMKGDAGGGTMLGGRRVTDRCTDASSAFEPLVAQDGETCYEFQVHENSSPTDTAKFSVPPGESYNQFYYDIPWPTGTVATRFGARFDNLPVLHHWLGFTSTSPNAPGTVARNVTGTTLGENSELVGGWAVGGCNTEFPQDMGLKLPDSGRIMIQWHHYNTTDQNQPDGSAVQWCTVPASMRPNLGGITFLGTENFNGFFGMPPGVQSEFTTSCSNTTSKPITIVGFSPHMHLLGINMKSVLERPGMPPETVFDEPFVFDQQVNYDVDPPIVLQPGDKITTTCTFNNTTNSAVAFGQSTNQEMCYQFALAYPYGALNSGVLSLIGATNTCW